MERLAGHLTRRGLTGADPTAFVFASPSGGPLDYAHWRQRVWLPATRSSGLVGLTFHDLRRANATGLVAEGVDVKTAQARLGHADPRLTLAIYAQATTEADRSAAARIGARFLTTTAPGHPTPSMAKPDVDHELVEGRQDRLREVVVEGESDRRGDHRRRHAAGLRAASRCSNSIASASASRGSAG